MRIRTKLTSSLAVAGVLALGTVGVAPAQAAGCPSGWTEPVAGICQVIVTGSATITIPSGAAGLSAVMVGAGGGGAGTSAALSAGGASGDVVYLTPLSARSDGTVFAAAGVAGAANAYLAPGGTGSLLIDGSGSHSTNATTDASIGGQGHGGDNTNFLGAYALTAGGAGSSSDASGNAGGSGFSSFSAIPGADTTIWPNTSASDSSVFDTTAGLGRGGFGQAAAAFSATSYGSGGTGWSTAASGPTAGIGGVVVLRFQYAQGGSSTATPTETSAGLASTGSDASTWGVLAAVAALAGAAALGLRRKVRGNA